jgi:hypothetical protein
LGALATSAVEQDGELLADDVVAGELPKRRRPE